MKEVKVDLWDYCSFGLCITTNGTVKYNNCAVMGRGCALEAKQRIPNIDQILGSKINRFGNHVWPLFCYRGQEIYSFPVKHDWWDKADIELIKRSCMELCELVKGRIIALPRPGCGNGHLKWEDVKPVIEPLLPDNIVVVSK